MNRTRLFFLVRFHYLLGLFGFNLHTDEVTTDWEGGTYTGEVVGGVPNGQGTLTDPDGSKYVGEWNYDNHWQGTEYDKDGNVTGTYSEGVWTVK